MCLHPARLPGHEAPTCLIGEIENQANIRPPTRDSVDQANIRLPTRDSVDQANIRLLVSEQRTRITRNNLHPWTGRIKNTRQDRGQG